MTINRSFRKRLKSEGSLVKAAAQRKGILQKYIARIARSEDTGQSSLDSENFEPVEATVVFETGETIKVKAPDVKRFLLENQGKLESYKRQRRGKPRHKN